MRTLPRGTVTFLFTDVEGSTRLLHELGEAAYAAALDGHRRVIRDACSALGGVEVDTQGDAFLFAFEDAGVAVRAAVLARDGLAPGLIRVRAGIHTGTPLVTDEGYVGFDLHRAARIAAAGHGGQILVSAAAAGASATRHLHDLGEHRLKDLSEPERIFQVGADPFPPLRTLYRSTLPVPASPFVGRERELAEVVQLLTTTRLLTLTGAGGTGKTRIALQAAAAGSDDYPDGVHWVPLADLRDPRLVLETAARAVGAKGPLADHIGDGRLLLLFDNVEHVVAGAPALAALLERCPNLDVLATSREPLHLRGEQEYPVPPFVHAEAVGFFLARARAIDPAFAVDDNVSSICERLDDLPLALELAAARIKALTTAQILERLDHRLQLLARGAADAPARQRTLRAALEWSYDLLEPDEQRLFGRLAVFRGGWTLADAEAICDADVDTLHALVDKSLVRRTGARYRMLETIRELALELLDDETRQRHARHFERLALDTRPHLYESEWVARVEAENDNMLAAIDWLCAVGDTDPALRIAGLMGVLWQNHAWPGSRLWLRAVLDRAEAPTQARADALLAAANFELAQGGDPAVGRRLAEEAVALHRRFGDANGLARALRVEGWLTIELDGDFARAQALFEESAARFEEIGYEPGLLMSRNASAHAMRARGNVRGARATHEAVLERARVSNSEFMVAASLSSLADLLVDGEETPSEALALYRQSLELWHDHASLCEIVQHGACALAQLGETRTAATLLVWSTQELERLGSYSGRISETSDRPRVERTRASLRDSLGPGWEADAELEAAALTADRARELLGAPVPVDQKS